MNVQPLILCGGSGTRMWPLSREQYPKQLLSLAGELSMLQATALRLKGLPLSAVDTLNSPILIGNEEYRFLMAEQMRQVGVAHGGMQASRGGVGRWQRPIQMALQRCRPGGETRISGHRARARRRRRSPAVPDR